MSYRPPPGGGAPPGGPPPPPPPHQYSEEDYRRSQAAGYAYYGRQPTYGGRPPYMGSQGYGAPPPPPPQDMAVYAQRAQAYGYPPHAAASGTSPDQRGYPHPPPHGHGMPPGGHQYYYPREMYAQRPPGAESQHPYSHHPYGPGSSPNAPSPKNPLPSSRPSPPGIAGSGSKGQSGDDDDDDDEGKHGDDSNAGSGSEKDNDSDDDDEHGGRHDHAQKWFHGSVPLGLEDDKYWLSELQVYLRANFAEAFGATEEDIAGTHLKLLSMCFISYI